MPTPEEIVEERQNEQQRLSDLTASILSKLDDLGTSDYWSWAGEYELGKVSSVKLLMENIRDHLDEK